MGKQQGLDQVRSHFVILSVALYGTFLTLVSVLSNIKYQYIKHVCVLVMLNSTYTN